MFELKVSQHRRRGLLSPLPRLLDRTEIFHSPLGDETSAVAPAKAPGNNLVLNVANGAVGLGRAPEAEVLDAVDDDWVTIASQSAFDLLAAELLASISPFWQRDLGVSACFPVHCVVREGLDELT